MTNKSLPSIHFSQGSLLIGAYFNLVIYTLDALGFCLYFNSKRSKSDSRLLKAIVVLGALVDNLGTIGTLTACYILCINYSRHDTTIEAPMWSLCLWWMCNTFASFLVQSFMIRRLWHLTKNIIVASCISILMLASKGAMLYVGVISMTKSRNLRTRYQNMASVAVALGASAVTDISLAVALLLRLAHWSTLAHTDSTKRMVHTVAYMAVSTGGVTSTVGIAELILFAACPAMRVSTGVGFIVGRVYVATMLFTLLYRDRISDMRHSVHVSPETSNRADIENGLQTPAPVHLKPHLDTMHIESTNIYTDSGRPTLRRDSYIQTHDTLSFGHRSNLILPTPIDDSEVVLAHTEKNQPLSEKNTVKSFTDSTSSTST